MVDADHHAETNVLKDRDVCRFCCQKVAVSYLREHYMAHFNYKPLICQLCLAEFPSERLIRLHCQSKHGIVIQILVNSVEKTDKFVDFIVEGITKDNLSVDSLTQSVDVAKKLYQPLFNTLDNELLLKVFENKSVPDVVASVEFIATTSTTATVEQCVASAASEHVVAKDTVVKQGLIPSGVSTIELIVSNQHKLNGERTTPIQQAPQISGRKEGGFTARKTMPYSRSCPKIATTPNEIKRHKCIKCQKEVSGASSIRSHVFKHLPTNGVTWLVECLMCSPDNPYRSLYRHNLIDKHLIEFHRLNAGIIEEGVHFFDRTSDCQQIFDLTRVQCFGEL